MIGSIYKLVFPDGKYYIGSTIRSLEERLWEHKKHANPQNITQRNLPVYLHWRKFDIHSVKIELVEEIETQNIRDIRYLEAEYIKLMIDDPDCLTKGYSYSTKEEQKEWKRQYWEEHHEKLKAYDTAWHRKRRAENKQALIE